MKKLDRSKLVMLVVTTLLTILPMFVGILLWNQLPDQISMEFATRGTFGEYSPKWVPVILLPVFFTIAHVIAFVSLANTDDAKKERYGLMGMLGYILGPCISIICAVATFGTALGYF